MRMGRTVALTALMAVAALMVLGAGTGGATQSGGNSHLVVVHHGEFAPRELTVAPGDTVTWRNDDTGDAHSITADDGSFDSHPECTKDAPDKCLTSGGTFSHTFPKPGRFPYHSRTEGQTGTIVVAP